MRKSKLVLLLLLIVSLALFTSGCDTLMPDLTPENGDTENGEVTDPSYFVFNDTTQTITGYNKEEGPENVVIPSEIDNVDVKKIGEEAFNRMYYLTSVEIPDTVTIVESEAFRADQLDSVDIGNSVEEIRGAAFNTNSLTEVDIPDSVTLIGEDAFTGNKLTSVEIGKGVDVDVDAFEGNFKEAYENNNKSGGVYKRDNDDSNDWYKQ
ncbi:leucine-rich repeat domain-containing protein [Candidatus Bipolaricaulota bacterium]|nr:leucine-rich repeat domain-containing protein [Candidatus Bipolaricaulota bacterium]